jgi:UDP-GlcNAc3NAcA epimerase
LDILTIIGARPQFIKAAPLSKLINESFSDEISETLIHTGQHFDKEMSEIFFEELQLPKPFMNLNISSLTHGAMTGRMIEELESVISQRQPDKVLVYGDTNSTLAGAIAASKLNIPIIHIEAGLRSFNMSMPEEINRTLTDRLSSVLFCPSSSSVDNLVKENIRDNVFNVGDIMRDSIELFNSLDVQVGSDISKLLSEKFVLLTLHRQENTDNKESLSEILDALNNLAKNIDIIFPIHPRTKTKIEEFGINELLSNITVIHPLSFFQIQQALSKSTFLITDSGGMQKESYYQGIPCITLRQETEWRETVEVKMNYLLKNNYHQAEDIIYSHDYSLEYDRNIYGKGDTAKSIIKILLSKQ